jgi:hypothetical protein
LEFRLASYQNLKEFSLHPSTVIAIALAIDLENLPKNLQRRKSS